MFNALISHLAQQMNQDALAYLESSPSRTAQIAAAAQTRLAATGPVSEGPAAAENPPQTLPPLRPEQGETGRTG